MSSIEYRTFDGSGNNLSDPDLNAAGTGFLRIGVTRFADGISALVGGPNPRMISNVVVGEGDAAVANPQGVSGMMYAWGQFIDHDLDLTRSGSTHIDIPVPAGDSIFPDGSVIAMTRAIVDPASGTAANAITGWLDASMVYGSNEATAASLREPDGHMRASAGGNLPIVNGMFAAGDVRAAENPALTALQALFIREHNYQVDRLHREHPEWSGDQLYQHARAIVAAEIAHITYSEFLPLLIGSDAISPYGGYDASVDARITLEFSGAAFRFGHSIVSGETERIDENGNVTGPELELRDTFFMAPADFAADGGADGFLRHLASDASQAMDGRIVEDLRNFLFDPPVAMDLAAINIQRGRDLGLGTLNQTRVAFGLAPYTEFEQITDDPGTVAALRTAFGSVDLVDLWTGGLSEGTAPGALVGPTFQRIIALQFQSLRDGDRFWHENQGFDAATLSEIEHTTLADILRRNTDTEHIQDDVFVFYNRHSGVAEGVEAEDPDARQIVIGADGIDALTGGPDDDFLFAGHGSQILTGGSGADRFVVDAGTSAIITDFAPGEDRVEFSGGSIRDVQLWSMPGGTLLQVGDVAIGLVGIQSWQLGAADFLFGD